MTSTSSLFHGRFSRYSKQDRGFNIGSIVPFAVTSLFIATIFSFFLLFSPNSLTLLPYQNHPDHKQQNHTTIKVNPSKPQEVGEQIPKFTPSKPQEEQKPCDLFHGQWVRALRESSYYTNSSCPSIPESKNCFKNGRMDSDFLNWKWKPEECELARFDSKAFLHHVRGKKLAFIGDSVARNHMDSLLCLLSQEETPQEIYKDEEDRYPKWLFPKSNFTIISLWSRFLITAEERMINGTGSSIFDLYLDKADEDWTTAFPDLDYAIISAGHWFFRLMYLHQGPDVIGCVYCNQPNIKDYNIDFPLRMAFRAVFNFINNCAACTKTLTLVRTFAPAHFENGAWNTGGYCNRTGPASEAEIDWKRFEWQLRKAQMEEFERGRREGEERGKRYEVVDVTKAMMMRPDGHPGDHWGNKWMKGYNDCTHWCIPGPVDFWSELLQAIIQRHPPS